DCCIQLCGPVALAWPGAQGAPTGGSRAEETFELTSRYRSFPLLRCIRFDLAARPPPAHCKGHWFFARVAELADAYGSGPYGETRGGSSPLASRLEFSLPRIEKHRQAADCSRTANYLRAAFLRAAHRAFINCDSLLRPAAVSPPFLAEGAFFVPAAFLLAAQRALISSESFFRPAAVSAPFFLAAAGFFPPFSLAQRALAAAESLARVEGEK